MLTIVILAAALFGGALVYVFKTENVINKPLLTATLAWPAALAYQYAIFGCPINECTPFADMPFVWSALLMVTASALSKQASMYNKQFAMQPLVASAQK